MLNEVRVMGYLGADPEVRTTPNGNTSATFRLACSERWTDGNGQRQEHTEWVTCVAWRKDAELVQMYLRKGSRALVQGKLHTRTWEDKNGGGKRYATEVVVARVILVDKKEQGERQEPSEPARRQARASQPSAQTSMDQEGGDPDDLPF